jgi:hypothetical protein
MAIGDEAAKVDNTHKRYWNIEAKDAETRMTQKLEHECWNTDAGTRMTQMLEHEC